MIRVQFWAVLLAVIGFITPGLAHPAAPASLDIRFDYGFALVASKAIRDGRLDRTTEAELRKLPQTAAIAKKLRLKDTQAVMDHLRALAARAEVMDAASRVASELEREGDGKYAPLGAEAVRQLRNYVPPEFTAKLTVHLIFGSHSGGFAFDDDIGNVYVNLARLSQGTTQELAELVAHELFHAVQGHVMHTPPRPAPGSAPSTHGQIWMTRLLYDLVQEGTAELFTHQLAEREATVYSGASKLRMERNARRIASITTMFETVGLRLLLAPPRDEDEYDRIYGLMFYTGLDELAYDLGWLMSSTIEKADGKGAIFALLRQPPKQFVLRYQQLAQGNDKLPKFSGEFLRAVAALP